MTAGAQLVDRGQGGDDPERAVEGAAVGDAVEMAAGHDARGARGHGGVELLEVVAQRGGGALEVVDLGGHLHLALAQLLALAGRQRVDLAEGGAAALELLEREITDLACRIHAATCRWLELVAEYDRRRQVIVGGLNSIGLKTFEPQGAFYAFPYVGHLGLSSEQFCERLLVEEQVAVIPGDAFGPSGAGFVRACYATSMDKMEDALEGIERFGRRVS